MVVVTFITKQINYFRNHITHSKILNKLWKLKTAMEHY